MIAQIACLYVHSYSRFVNTSGNHGGQLGGARENHR